MEDWSNRLVEFCEGLGKEGERWDRVVGACLRSVGGNGRLWMVVGQSYNACCAMTHGSARAQSLDAKGDETLGEIKGHSGIAPIACGNSNATRSVGFVYMLIDRTMCVIPELQSPKRLLC